MGLKTRRIGQLPPAQLKAVRDCLDKQESRKPAKCRRGHARLKYPRDTIAVHIKQSGGSGLDVVMAAQDIGVNGIGLLYPHFLHVGTECRVTLRRRLGGEDTVSGTVVQCRFVGGICHAVSVKFAAPLFVKHYLEPDECDELLDQSPKDPSKLKGRVLMLDDQEIDRMLFLHYMGATGCEVVAVRTLKEAAEAATASPPQLILCDLNLDGTRGETAIANFRAAGYQGYIVVLTAESDQARLKAAIAAGANDVFFKPYDPGKLLLNLAGWLQAANGHEVHSTLADQPGTEPLIVRYIGQVKAIAAQLHSLLADANLQQVRKLCLTLKGTGSGYGFAMLSEAASDTVKVLDSSQSVEESLKELQLLLALCARLSSGTAPDSGMAVLSRKKIDGKLVG